MEKGIVNGLYTRWRLAQGNSRGRILYLHGLGESSYCFEGLIQHPALGEWDHWAPDLVGYGKSPRSRKPLSLARQVDQVAEWWGRDDKVVVLGHSMGGVAGLHFCEAHQELCRGFINVEGNVSWGDCNYSAEAWKCTPRQFRREGFSPMIKGIKKGAKSNRPLQVYYKSMVKCDPRAFHRNACDLVSASMPETVPLRLKAVADRIPALYIGGAAGGVVPRSVELLEKCGVPFESVEDAGHWPFIDQPQAFVKIVVRFLRDLPE